MKSKVTQPRQLRDGVSYKVLLDSAQAGPDRFVEVEGTIENGRLVLGRGIGLSFEMTFGGHFMARPYRSSRTADPHPCKLGCNGIFWPHYVRDVIQTS